VEIYQRHQPFPFPTRFGIQVQTSNYSAEYGSNAGGVVNVITSPARIVFHGDAFDSFAILCSTRRISLPRLPLPIASSAISTAALSAAHPPRQNIFLWRLSAHRVSYLALGSQKVVGQTDINNFLAPKLWPAPLAEHPRLPPPDLLE